MGNLVTLTLYTDDIDQVEKHPKEFAEVIMESVNRGGGKCPFNLPTRFGQNGSVIIQKVRHSSQNAIYFQSGNTVTEIGTHSDDVERLLVQNTDILEQDLKYIQSVVTSIKKRIKENKESV